MDDPRNSAGEGKHFSDVSNGRERTDLKQNDDRAGAVPFQMPGNQDLDQSSLTSAPIGDGKCATLFFPTWDERRVATTASNPREAHMSQSLSVLALNGRCERFIYVYDDASRETLLDHLRHQAADPSVAVSWTEYHLLAERARRQARESAKMQETSGD